MNSMMNPMMNGMNPMMPQGAQPTQGVQPMQMGMPQMQPQPMVMMPMPMPAQNVAAPPMACKMTYEMTSDGIVCKLTAVDPSHLEMLRERMHAMMGVLGMGVPLVVACGAMPMLVAVPTPKQP